MGRGNYILISTFLGKKEGMKMRRKEMKWTVANALETKGDKGGD